MSPPESEGNPPAEMPTKGDSRSETTNPTDSNQSTEAEPSASGNEDTSDRGDPIVERGVRALLESRQQTRQRLKSAILWGSIGVLIFLVSVQAYVLVGGEIPTGYARVLGVAAVIGGIVALVAYTTEYRLIPKGRT